LPAYGQQIFKIIKLKDFSPQRRGDAEFYFVNGACGAVNNAKFFSVSQRLCGESF